MFNQDIDHYIERLTIDTETPNEETINMLPDTFPTPEDRLHLTSTQILAAKDIKDSRLNPQTRDWLAVLEEEISPSSRRQSFVIDLNDRQNEHWDLREEYFEDDDEEGDYDDFDGESYYEDSEYDDGDEEYDDGDEYMGDGELVEEKGGESII